MKKLGIIANPASGKDIRRLVAYATVIDNNEKVNIVKRIILAAQAAGVKRIEIMPDSFRIGYSVIETLSLEEKLHTDVQVLDMVVTGSMTDTVSAAAAFEAEQVGCVIVLGGDGTSRAAAKALKDTPLLPISTGTNNVYPDMTEGTIAGLAAAVTVQAGDVFSCCSRDKRIEVYRDGQLIDIALVDAVVSTDSFAGARAIWHSEDIRLVVAARAYPESIGFSSFIAAYQTVDLEDDFGLATWPDDKEGNAVWIPISAGVVERVSILPPRRLKLGEDFDYVATEDSMVALDGEREINLKKGEEITFRITRNGPLRVDVSQAMAFAQQNQVFFDKN